MLRSPLLHAIGGNSSMLFGGNIQLILGPMFSGKTGELFRRIRRYNIAKKDCILIKYSADTRYSVDSASTHDRFIMEALPTDTLEKIESVASRYDVIGIDEGQFFPDLVEFSERMANVGKVVIVACLDGTFQRKLWFSSLQPFGRVLELVPLAESVTKLTAVCVGCQHEAYFSCRIGSETAVELIGGSDKYVAMCRACFFSHQQHAGTPTAATATAAGPTATASQTAGVESVDSVDEADRVATGSPERSPHRGSQSAVVTAAAAASPQPTRLDTQL